MYEALAGPVIRCDGTCWKIKDTPMRKRETALCLPDLLEGSWTELSLLLPAAPAFLRAALGFSAFTPLQTMVVGDVIDIHLPVLLD